MPAQRICVINQLRKPKMEEFGEFEEMVEKPTKRLPGRPPISKQQAVEVSARPPAAIRPEISKPMAKMPIVSQQNNVNEAIEQNKLLVLTGLITQLKTVETHLISFQDSKPARAVLKIQEAITWLQDHIASKKSVA